MKWLLCAHKAMGSSQGEFFSQISRQLEYEPWVMLSKDSLLLWYVYLLQWAFLTKPVFVAYKVFHYLNEFFTSKLFLQHHNISAVSGMLFVGSVITTHIPTIGLVFLYNLTVSQCHVSYPGYYFYSNKDFRTLKLNQTVIHSETVQRIIFFCK